jgi:hypothetical protein
MIECIVTKPLRQLGCAQGARAAARKAHNNEENGYRPEDLEISKTSFLSGQEAIVKVACSRFSCSAAETVVWGLKAGVLLLGLQARKLPTCIAPERTAANV